MSADILNDADSIKTQFVRVVKDFSQYLSFQHRTGNTFLNLSEKSSNLIENWGQNREISDPFLHQGPENADLFIIDSESAFFKGESGELLIKILKAMKLSAESVFICNIVNDLKYVHAKIETISPKVIITLGTKAGQSFLDTSKDLETFHGRFHDYKGIKVMPTFHPSLLLQKPQFKRQVWDDMKKVMQYAGIRYD